MIDSSFSLTFPQAFESTGLTGKFRHCPEDFFVEEVLGFSLSGEGEHVCLYIEKEGHNTHWVAAELARFAGIKERDIGVCGRKDRHAITRQWFSLYYPLHQADRQEPNWSSFTMEGVRILQVTRHRKKLRLGDHQTNRFVIRLRGVTDIDNIPLSAENKPALLEKLHARLCHGVPNYYGEQRFGRGGGNIAMAYDWFVNRVAPPRKQRSMVLSAARSYLFNLVLSYRVRHGMWGRLIDGDVVDENDPNLPTGPLWGRGRLPVTGEALDIEQKALEQYALWCERLEHLGLHQERRSLVLKPQAVELRWQEDDLILSFNLPIGTFATSVLAEVTRV